MRNILLLSLWLFGTSCKSPAQQIENTEFSLVLKALLSHSVKEVGVRDVEPSDSVLFLDARAINEYNVSHIKNAVFVGYDHFDAASLNGIDKNKKLIVYCSVGYRSEKISEKLEKLGYTNIYNLYGGIFEWKNVGKKVYDNKGQVTEKVHAYDNVWGRWLQNGEKCFDK